MSFSDWGVIAEIVSAFGVVISLAYLAYEIRQATKQSEFQAFQTAREAYLKDLDGATWTPEEAEIFINGLNCFDEMPSSQKASFHSHLHALFHGFHGILNLYHLGKLPEYELISMRIVLISFLLSPGGRRWFESYKHVPPPQYVAYLQAEMQKAEGVIKPANEEFPWYRKN